MAANYDEEKVINTSDRSSPQISPSRETKDPWTRRFVDSFKRDPNAALTGPSETADPKGGFDHAAAAERTANSGLAKKLKGRHMQMIAIGGSIGELIAPGF